MSVWQLMDLLRVLLRKAARGVGYLAHIKTGESTSTHAVMEGADESGSLRSRAGKVWLRATGRDELYTPLTNVTQVKKSHAAAQNMCHANTEPTETDSMHGGVCRLAYGAAASAFTSECESKYALMQESSLGIAARTWYNK
jgi:hypothetical protein